MLPYGGFSTCLTLALLAQIAFANESASQACTLLQTALPDKIAFLSGSSSSQYTTDNAHWAGSSSESSTCSVEPNSRSDLVTIFKIINQTRTEWAVKGGGHTYNPGFSSTAGVLISLNQFNEVTYESSTSTARIGGGNIWDDVYTTMTAQGVNVVGSRISGVGVGGFILGGGYGWSTQQYGLAIDTVVGFEIVTPGGQILDVTEQSYPDLFLGLRGGGNNFGIVTTFILKTHLQGQVYGGPIVYFGDMDSVRQALVDFDATNQDPKAVVMLSYTLTQASFEAVVFLFYDGPSPPPETFEVFLTIPAAIKNLESRSFPDFIKSINLAPPHPIRIAVQTVPIIRYTMPIVQAIVNQTRFLGDSGLVPRSNGFATLCIEPFISTLYDHSRGGAYPHSPAHPWTPFQVVLGYTDSSNDSLVRDAVHSSAHQIQQIAIQEGQSSEDAILYNNFSPLGTSLSLLFGDNLETLRQLRIKYDPQNLLSLTGGWRF